MQLPLLLLLAACITAVTSTSETPDGSHERGATGPDGAEGDGETECLASEEEKCASEQCRWTSAQGVSYSLEDFSSRAFKFSLQKPRGAVLNFHLCPTATAPSILCNNGRRTPACITVPGVNPTCTGSFAHVEQIEPHAPGKGFKLVYEDGDVCQVTKKPRRTVISLPCASPGVQSQASTLSVRKAFEGESDAICNYFVEFPPSQFGCPVAVVGEEGGEGVMSGGRGPRPELSAVSGCTDSQPLRSTEDCHYATQPSLTLHGINFDLFCDASFRASSGPTPSSLSAPAHRATTSHPAPFNSVKCSRHFGMKFGIFAGDLYECKEVKVLSRFELSCKLERGTGEGLDLSVRWRSGGEVVTSLEAAVGYKEAIDFREKFSKFVELGVGGLKKEIDELYRRAFASRGTPPSVLEKLGVAHIKGILLYGPPGSGKTLLARTIARIMGTEQVKLINGPEVISKYLGESEKNLRAHFKDAHTAWEKRGALSELHVIIIDEIDAICKPRGKADQSAAGVAYDALVNQLLTLMDGLTEVHNTLVVGLTNRRELLDSALLRPGRFEVQIEVGLPDEQGRWEIFEIHTRSMRNSSMLSPDVDLWELAANTTRFSGAEISGVVRAAASYALERYQLGGGGGGGGGGEVEQASVLVTAEDFHRALLSVNPAYTHSEAHVLSSYLPLGYLPCGEAHEAVLEGALELMTALKQGATTRLQTVLLYGPRGSGKTSAAVHLATLGRFSFVRVLTASDLVGRHDLWKIDLLYQTFNDAFKSETAVVILDDLHRLVEFVTVGSQISVSHSILHAINTLLTATPPQGSKVLVIGTMTADDAQSLEDTPASLGLPQLFLRQFHVPLLDPPSVLALLSARNIHRLGGGKFSLPGNLEISMQQLVHALECACVLSHAHCGATRPSPAYLKQDHLTECIMTFVTRRGGEFSSSTVYGQ